MNKTVLIIVFHFPPIATSSGMQRALKTVRYLRELGWRPIVLTVHPRAYSKTTTGQLAEIPDDVPVHRVFCLDTTRHLAIRGRYLRFMSWPDQWISWWPTAVYKGLQLIRRHRPSIIWSTFPINTTNLVALQLAQRSRLPWVADLRDPISMEGYPADPMRFRCARWIERKTVERARRVIFTAEHTRKMYAKRYTEAADKFVLIPNGYDEANFPDPLVPVVKGQKEKLTIVHSGAMQPDGRNPTVFFEALRDLKQDSDFDPQSVRIVFRACGFEKEYQNIAEKLGVSDFVTFAEYLPYDEAIHEMVSADGLMVFQGTIYNHAVPAKLYEYLYARTPIFALVDKDGETASVLRQLGITNAASIDNREDIAVRFGQYIRGIRSRTHAIPETSLIEQYSRRRQVERLSRILEEEVGV